ncbi:MAG: C69 family dipeptidase [Eubacterium sp.]|nr:C69 family dipeptidase [Eubacterium sp.]
MKRGLKYIITAILVIVFSTVGAAQAFACTAYYVGSKASADGTVILAKSNDFQHVWANHLEITERVENEEGRTMPVDLKGAVQTEIPATTYRYTSTPIDDSVKSANDYDGRDAAICANEYGVVMIMSITAFSNHDAVTADPLAKKGLCEFTAVDLVTCQSKTAKEGVKNLFKLIDKYGSSEINIAFIADQKEVWYVEMYTGHQYAAVKLPDDKVCAFGNEFLLEYLSDYEDSITSPELESLAKENEFAVYGDNNELNLVKTYSGDSTLTDYSHRRTWMGHKLLAPEDYKEYNKEDTYPLCFEAEDKVSLQDVMGFMRNRFEGTEFNPDKTGRTDIRVIGTEIAINAHIAQIYPNYEADMSCVTWASTGPAIYGTFVPFSNAATSVSESYGKNQDAKEYGKFDVDYPYYRFKALTTLCYEQNNIKTYGKPVRNYWKQAEAGMTKCMPAVLETADGLGDSEAAHQYITNYCNAMQEQAFIDSGVLLNDVMWYMSENSNSMKNGKNPETHEVLDELKKVKPMKVNLDAENYSKVPEISEEEEEQSKSGIEARTLLIIIAGVIAGLSLIIAIILIAYLRKTRAPKQD